MTRNRFFGISAAALVALASKLIAQTLLPSHQLAAGESGRAWVNFGNRVRFARIDGLTLVEDGDDVVLRAAGGVTPEWRREQVIEPSATWTLAGEPLPGSLVAVRNGQVQWEGDDYTVAGSTVTLAYTWIGDRWIFRYQVGRTGEAVA